MSGYGEMYREQQHSNWLNKWVPRDDKALKRCPESFRDQYRSDLARMREAQAAVKEYEEVLRPFKQLLKGL